MGKKGKGSENIRVVIRLRDLLPNEIERGDKQAVRLDLSTQQVIVAHPIGDPDIWAFDAVFNNHFTQRDIYLQEVQPLVEAVMQGYNATVFAYGQSGSGKTYTMTGDVKRKELFGMMPQVVERLFDEVKKQSSTTKTFKVKVSYVELYLGKSRDLLADKQVTLEIRENLSKNFFVKGAEVIEVINFTDCMRLFNEGTARRQTASTDLNDTSSRSHALFMLSVEQHDFENDPTSPVVMTSKINIVDLAGSEKLSKTNATGETAKEGCLINLSLSALATVIDTIVKGGGHIPYRGSSLTMLLKDSLGGNSKTVMFANIGPSEKNVSETISTLRFAERAKQIENKPIKNMDPKDAKIAELMEKIEELQRRLGNADLNYEDDLKAKIEVLEVQNAELRGLADKDTLEQEERNRENAAKIEDLMQVVSQRDKTLGDLQSTLSLREAEFRGETEQMNELRAIVSNFVRQVCTQQQMGLIREKMLPELRPEAANENVNWSVRVCQYYLEGFLDFYSNWRKGSITDEEFKQRIARMRNESEEMQQAAQKNFALEKQELMRQHEESLRQRTVDTEQFSQMTVELGTTKEECEKLREKIDRGQEKMKKKMEKTKEEMRKLQEDHEAARKEITQRENEIGKLKKLLEELGGGTIGSSSGVFTPGQSSGTAADGHGPSGGEVVERSKLEAAEQRISALENRLRETNLFLASKGIHLKANTAAAAGGGGGGGGASPSGGEMTRDGEITDVNNEAFIIEKLDDNAIDSTLVSQLHFQIRMQHRLTELRHAHQKKLEDMIRKFELLKTGKITATSPPTPVAAGGVSGPALQAKLKEAMAGKDAEIETLKSEHQTIVDKLVRKINKKVQEFQDQQEQLVEERRSVEEERNELSKKNQELSNTSSQMSVELMTLKHQLEDAKHSAAGENKRKETESHRLKEQIEKLRGEVNKAQEKEDAFSKLQQEHAKIVALYAKSDHVMKEKDAALDNARQNVKWSNSMLEEERKKVSEAEQKVRDAENQLHLQEEAARQQLVENANKLVALNNKRLEEQAALYQTLVSEEQEKQKAVREKLKKAKAQSAKAAQRYDEMVLENEMLQTQFEELKISAMKMFRQRQEDAVERTAWPAAQGRGTYF